STVTFFALPSRKSAAGLKIFIDAAVAPFAIPRFARYSLPCKGRWVAVKASRRDFIGIYGI
ncbi:MAG: hypothetical protein SOZ74_01020, partial [Candidatus Fimenecus sp.]|nr:hypothetical protein [Candidatus Fimenecus sp.]